MRARAALANVERELRAASDEVTIHALWMALAGTLLDTLHHGCDTLVSRD